MAKGGLTKGKSHAEGGIKMKVKSTGQNIEVEGGEVIINKKNVSDPTKLDFEGEQKTTCEILSDLNSRNGNGVTLECDSVEGKKYKHEKGGKLPKDDTRLIIEVDYGSYTENIVVDKNNVEEVANYLMNDLSIYEATYVSGDMDFFEDNIKPKKTKRIEKILDWEKQQMYFEEEARDDWNWQKREILEKKANLFNEKAERGLSKVNANELVYYGNHYSTMDLIHNYLSNDYFAESRYGKRRFQPEKKEKEFKKGGKVGKEQKRYTVYATNDSGGYTIEPETFSNYNDALEHYEYLSINDVDESNDKLKQNEKNLIEDIIVYNEEEDEEEIIESNILKSEYIKSANVDTDEIIDEIQNRVKEKYNIGGYFQYGSKYQDIDVYDEMDEDEIIGCVQVRVADHSQNARNLSKSNCKEKVSFVIANVDPTANRFMPLGDEYYFKSYQTVDEIWEEIVEIIDEKIDNVRYSFSKGGKLPKQTPKADLPKPFELTYNRLKAKSEGKGRMPSLKSVSKLLDELKIPNFYYDVQTEKYSSPSGMPYYTSGGARTYKGGNLAVKEIRLDINSTDSYYSHNTTDYAEQLIDLIDKKLSEIKPKQTPKSDLQKALKGIEVAIEISGETKDLLKAKEGVEMAMGLSKPSLTKRQKLEQDLKNESVKIWFEKKDNITRQTNKKFLSISELTDVELNRLRNDIIIYGIKKGILSDKKGRTVFLNWELTTKKPKYKIYYLTENGAEKTLFFDNKKDALKELKELNKVDRFNNYTLLNISEWNKDLEDYINFKSTHTINRM